MCRFSFFNLSLWTHDVYCGEVVNDWWGTCRSVLQVFTMICVHACVSSLFWCMKACGCMAHMAKLTGTAEMACWATAAHGFILLGGTGGGGRSSSAVTGGSSDAARLVYSSGLGCSRSQPYSVTTNWCEISIPKRPTADIYTQSKLQLSHYASWCVHNTIQLFLQYAMCRVYYVCYFRQKKHTTKNINTVIFVCTVTLLSRYKLYLNLHLIKYNRYLSIIKICLYI